MASVYTNDLRLEEIGTGEQTGTWGNTTNTNLELIAEAFSYSSTGEAIANASTHTITVADGASDEARSLYLKCTGGGQACTVTLAPSSLSKVWVIENQTSYTLTFSQGSGANVAVLAGQVKMIATDGGESSAAVYDLFQDLAVPDLFVDDDLKLQSDGAVLSFGADGDVSLTHVADTALLLNAGMAIQFRDSAISIRSSADATLDLVADGDMNLTAGVDINVPANVGLTFGDDGEKIEGDGTDLTITGNNINLTATADVNIPSGVGLTFATAEKIESDGTDLSITVGSGGDINIPANIGLTFGDDGEKIEGDGTDLTITGNNINLTATADIVVPANVGITFGTGEKIEGDSTDLTVTSGAKINLTATSDVVIPSGVGLILDGSGNEKIESDGTDINISVGSSGDINIPANIGLTFGDDGEKIEGDGTDLTISGNIINLSPTSTVTVSGVVDITDTTDSSDATGDTGALRTEGGASIAKKLYVGTDLDVDGTTNLDNTDIDGTLVVDGSNISLDSTTTLNIDNSNTSNGITIGTATSGVPISIGHSTSETTINDNLTITGDLTVSGTTTTVNSTTVNLNDHNIVLDSGNSTSAVINGAGITIEGGSGDDATFSYNTTGPKFELKLGSSHEDLQVDQLIAASLDISGNADIDGTTNLDAVDIDGAVQIDATVTVGVDDTGYDVKFFGDTASAYMQWDASADDLILGGAAGLVVPESKLTLGSTAVTSTAAELNLLDGVSGLVQADFTKLAAVDSTAAELNIVDGGTSATSTTLADADRVVVNDNGTMVQVALTDFETYFESALDTLSNVTTVGALNSGSITSGFGTIDTGSSAITTTGLITGGSLDIDDVVINGANIGHTDDTDLITLADGVATVAGDLTAKTSDGALLKLQTSHTSMADGDVIGAIEFSAPDDSAGTDAITTAASIVAEADATFSSSVNQTDLLFKTGHSGAAATTMKLGHGGDLSLFTNGRGGVPMIFFDTGSTSTGGQGNAIYSNLSGQLCFAMDGNTSNVVFFLDDEDGQPIFTFQEENGTDIMDGGDTDVTIHKPLIVNSTYTGGGLMTTGGNIVIPDAGTIGSASDTDVLSIASTGVSTFSKAVVGSTDTDTSNTGSVTLDFNTNQNFVLTFTGDVTLANPSTESVGQSGVIVCIQDGTGSRTLSLGTDYETAGGAGITLSTAASAVDVIPYFVKASGSIQLGAVQKAFS